MHVPKCVLQPVRDVLPGLPLSSNSSEMRCCNSCCKTKGLWYTRAELKDLASDSLDLLKGAIFDERFAALFDLDVYGSIVGMFELNNLGVHTLTCLSLGSCTESHKL